MSNDVVPDKASKVIEPTIEKDATTLNKTSGESLTSENGSSVSSDQFSTDPLVAELRKITVEAKSIEQLVASLPQVIAENGDCLGLWFVQADQDRKLKPPVAIIDAQDDELGALEASRIRALSKTASESCRLHFITVKNAAPYQLVACPVVHGNRSTAVLVACFSLARQSETRQHWLMSMLAQVVTVWQQNAGIAKATIRLDVLNDTLSLVKRLDKTDSVTEAGMVLVNHLRGLLKVDQVSFSHVDRAGNNRLIAISDVEQLDGGSLISKTTLSACARAIQLQKPLVYPAVSDEFESSKMLEQHCRTHRLDGSICLPLSLENKTAFGAILISGKADRICQPHFVQHATLVNELVGDHLNIVFKANRSVVTVAKENVSNSLRKSIKKKLFMALCLIALVMLIPMPYRIGADCQLEPVVRRFVAAPYDGILEKTFVESGAVVDQDQLLARMDGRVLRIELSGAQADFQGAKKRRDSALAAGEVAQSHIARSEMKRHQSQIELLERRLENIAVRSPIAGVVVSGDLDKAQGAPLDMGQTLFEVGPLNEMVAELQVPESEIRFVKPNATVKIKLNAYPFRTFKGTVRSIHTRSEIVNDRNVFVAEVIMENSGQELRPGMKGSAKIEGGRHPIGWNLFHNAYEKARYWLVW